MASGFSNPPFLPTREKVGHRFQNFFEKKEIVVWGVTLEIDCASSIYNSKWNPPPF